MGEDYPVLRGQNLGIMIGGIIDEDYKNEEFYLHVPEPEGIFLYKPQNSLVPRDRMTATEYLKCIPPGTEQVAIPFADVRRVFVNGGPPKWFNYNYFETSFRRRNQTYVGRGEVMIELVKGPGIEGLIESLLARDLALRRGEPLAPF